MAEVQYCLCHFCTCWLQDTGAHQAGRCQAYGQDYQCNHNKRLQHHVSMVQAADARRHHSGRVAVLQQAYILFTCDFRCAVSEYAEYAWATT